jgi:hypothetical protein
MVSRMKHVRKTVGWWSLILPPIKEKFSPVWQPPPPPQHPHPPPHSLAHQSNYSVSSVLSLAAWVRGGGEGGAYSPMHNPHPETSTQPPTTVLATNILTLHPYTHEQRTPVCTPPQTLHICHCAPHTLKHSPPPLNQNVPTIEY